MGFETQEEAERWYENQEFLADQRKDEAMLASYALTYQPPEVAMKARIAFLEDCLRGVRLMAELEAANGSGAWGKAVKTIDEALALK